MSMYIDFTTAKNMIVTMESTMEKIFPQWEELSNDAKRYVMLRYSHMTFAFLAKERHDIHMEFSVESSRILTIRVGVQTFDINERDRDIINSSNLIWAVMPVVPDGCMSLSLDGSACAMRFECTHTWDSLEELYRDVVIYTNKDIPHCIYSIIPVDEDGNEYTDEVN